jgi:hypothetical protein
MKSLYLSVGALALAMLVASPDSVVAQINIGGIKVNPSQNQSNRNDDDEDQGQSSNRQGGQRSQSGNNAQSDQIQKFLQGGQGGQGQTGQGDAIQFRRNQQGQFPNAQRAGQSGVTLGTWQGGKWKGSNKIQNWTQVYGGEAQPFSSQWYESHPKAWKYDNNKANVWVVGSLPGVYNWLGWGNVPREYRANYGNVQHFDHAHYGNWYPLGVYSLMSGPGDDGTRIVQLVIDRHGNIAGNYYDMITAANYSISGNVTRQSQRVTWSLNKNKSVRFRAPLFELMQPYGTITVRLPGGEQYWQFVRLED